MVEVGGFECEFVKEPPNVIQTNCPICLQVLCEPSQVTCCGKSYCKSCIERVKVRNNPCPCCQESNFIDYPNKGLQQPLYGLQVYCTYKKGGCEWTGELGQLDKHRNLRPELEKVLEGCQFAKIKCIHCYEFVQRKQLHHHQNELCSKRPFSCEYCRNYKSTYDDVTDNHWPVCDCYPIQCPNKCGEFPKRRNLDSHLEDECSLTIIQCDFQYAGCEAKLARKEMSAHISDNLTSHISMLAVSHRLQQCNNYALEREVERLKQEVVTLTKDNAALKMEVNTLKKAFTESECSVQWLCSHVGLFPKIYTIENYENHILDGHIWYSPPFYSHLHGYKLCLEVRQNALRPEYIVINAYLMRGEFDDHLQWPFLGEITVQLKKQQFDDAHYTKTFTFTGGPESKRVLMSERNESYCGFADFILVKLLERNCIKNSCLHIRISDVKQYVFAS